MLDKINSNKKASIIAYICTYINIVSVIGIIILPWYVGERVIFNNTMELATFVLGAVTLVVTAVGIILAIAAFWSYSTIEGKALVAVNEKVDRAIKELAADNGDLVRLIEQKIDNNNAFNSYGEDAVDKSIDELSNPRENDEN